MINILYIIGPATGGMKKYLQLLTDNIDKEKYNIYLVGNKQYLKGFFTFKNIFFIPIKSKINLFTDFLCVVKLLKIIKRYKINLLHSQGFKATSLSAFVCFFTKTPLVSSIHTFLENKFYLKIFSVLSKLLKKIITGSETLRSDLIKNGIEKQRIITIYNGIDIHNDLISNEKIKNKKIELGFSEDYLLVGNVSRFAKQKGIKYYLESIPDVLKEIDNVRFLLVGEGPEEKNIKKTIEELNIQKFIKILPYQENINEILSILDLLILSSVSDVFPMIILEAMRKQIPVVATKVGGIPELINSEENGILVESKNSSALSKAIISLLNDEEKRKNMGKRGKEILEKKFTKEIMVENTIKVYEEILGIV